MGPFVIRLQFHATAWMRISAKALTHVQEQIYLSYNREITVVTFWSCASWSVYFPV